MKSILLGLAFLFLGASVHAQKTVTYAYKDHNGKTDNVEAVMREPVGGQGLKKAVVILHSASGWGANTTAQYGEFLSANGYVTLEPRLFNVRGDANISRDIARAFGALQFLGENASIDKKNISLAGQSYGGFVTLFAATETEQKKYAQGDIKFRSYAPFYPLCWLIAKGVKHELEGVFSSLKVTSDYMDKWAGVPMRIFAGGKDDYDSRNPNACADAVATLQDEKQRSLTSVQLYPNATHGWDQGGGARFYDRNACGGKGCTNSNEYDASVTQKGKDDLLAFLNSLQ